MTQNVPTSIRQNIFDGLKIGQVSWSGSLEEADFLSRLYDLTKLPSGDRRYPDAAGDIYQHRVNNLDWDDDWVYFDNRFNLLHGSAESFLRFLCEIVHPVIRPEVEVARKLVDEFNDQLRMCGWAIAEADLIAGRPRFVARPLSVSGAFALKRGYSAAESLNAEWMRQEMRRAEAAIETDPSLAIGTAKELIETCCKTILTERGVEYSSKALISDLTKLLTRELSLVPEGIPDSSKGVDTIRLLMRNLPQLTQYLDELRNLYGSGHGRDGKRRGLQPRHARLAVGSAAVFVDFIVETHLARGPSIQSTRLPPP